MPRIYTTDDTGTAAAVRHSRAREREGAGAPGIQNGDYTQSAMTGMQIVRVALTAR
jgi:hypothetical protein